MEHFAGLDVSVKETSVCIVDETGKIVREVKVASEPEALLEVLRNGCLSLQADWTGSRAAVAVALQRSGRSGLAGDLCRDAAHAGGVCKAQINKTDRNDARGIAQMMRAGLYRPVHVKTLRSQKLRTLLTHRKLLQSKAIAIENDLRGTLRNFGLKVGIVGTAEVRGAHQGAGREPSPIWPCWSSRCSLSGGCCASSSPSCTAACWPSSGTTRCAGG